MAPFADAQPGDSLPTAKRTPDARELFFFEAASWQPTPASDASKANALPIPGELRAAWMSQSITDWLGSRGTLAGFAWEDLTEARLGDTYEVHGSVAAVDPASGEVTLDLRVESGAGVIVSTASARVRPA